ncbi:hypothetical protein [Actinopolymorpha sp. B9G3]|uniref:hypothetical protein n=1 Tax=Actinopolymorpha sp. B9G3 TaxID=3158970 RepID=UPI0032D913E7
MVALQIRDVPEEVRDVLATQAKIRGQSLQAYLLEMVTMEARRASTVGRILQQFEGRTDGSRLTRGAAGRLVDEVRAGRDRRAGHDDHDDDDHDTGAP